MIPVRVAGIAVDARGAPVLLLKPVGEEPGAGRVLPIWIGGAESASILIAVQGETPPRPLGHDLMRELLDAVGARITRTAVTHLDEGTYYAELRVTLPDGGERAIDCRPSDAIALAARVGAPLEVAEEVLETAGIDDEYTGEDDDEKKVEEFREFLDTIDPEDFQG